MLTITTKNERNHRQRSFSQPAICVGGEPDCDFVINGGAAFSIDQGAGETGKQIQICNNGRSIALSSGPRLHRGRKVTLDLPVSFCVGTTQFQICNPLAKQKMDQGLTSLSSIQVTESQDETCRRRASPAPETLGSWLETLSELQQAAAGSRELFELAAQAIFNP